jgi:hypothetical protein
LNPKNLNTTGIDCDILFPEYEVNYRKLLVDSLHDKDESEEKHVALDFCFREAFAEKIKIELLLSFDYLGEKELTAFQKEAFRVSYVTIRNEITKTAMRCLSSPSA